MLLLLLLLLALAAAVHVVCQVLQPARRTTVPGL
jgi:hypothetical protein